MRLIASTRKTLTYSSLNETGTKTLNGFDLKAAGGIGNGDAFFTISKACLSNDSKPLEVWILVDSTLPLPSI